MKLRLKPLNSDIKLMYSNHSHYKQGDVGLDIFFPEDILIMPGIVSMIDLGIQCEGWMAGTQVPYYLYPRSSISKTPLRMANSVGIIDAGYRGNIMVAIDNISDNPYQVQKGQRLFQICPWMDLTVDLEVVDTLSVSERGNAGFGSTGQ